MTRLLLATTLLVFAGAASAQPVEAENKIKAEAAADAKVDRFCIKETGTRIPVARKASSKQDQKQCVASNGRVYTRDDINSTGRVDLAEALRALDPSIR